MESLHAQVRVVQITDTHIGESCGGILTYEDCKPVRTLADAVARVNELDPQPTAVLITGDITSSALMPEFEKAYELLSAIKAPWYPILGNHDSWPYTRNEDGSFDQTATPIGDQFIISAICTSVWGATERGLQGIGRFSLPVAHWYMREWQLWVSDVAPQLYPPV